MLWWINSDGQLLLTVPISISHYAVLRCFA
jgi:hypothetical protein